MKDLRFMLIRSNVAVYSVNPRIRELSHTIMFVHCVYFWLRDDLSEEDHATFVEGVTSLTTIESVRHGFVGTPADTDRPIIDRSYSYGLVCVFDSDDDHEAYQVDSVHDEFRDTCALFWKQVKIYDVDAS